MEFKLNVKNLLFAIQTIDTEVIEHHLLFIFGSGFKLFYQQIQLILTSVPKFE